MKCYQTNPQDGVFVGVAFADPDPREPGRMVLPGACLETAPPAYAGGQQARWSDTGWILEAAPAVIGMRDGAPCGVLVSWDGEDFAAELMAAPEFDPKTQAVRWDGMAWSIDELPAPPAPPAIAPPEVLTPAQKLAAIGLTIDDLKALGVQVS